MGFFKKLKGGLKAVGKVAARAVPKPSLFKSVARGVVKVTAKTGSLAKATAKKTGSVAIKTAKTTRHGGSAFFQKAGTAAKASAKFGGKVASRTITTGLKVAMLPSQLALKTTGLVAGTLARGAFKAVGGAVSAARGGGSAAAAYAPEEAYEEEVQEEAAEEYEAAEEAPVEEEYAEEEVQAPDDGDTQAIMSEPADADYEEGDAEQMGSLDYAYALADAEGTGMEGVWDTLKNTLTGPAAKNAALAAGGSLLVSAATKVGLDGRRIADERPKQPDGLFGLSMAQTMIAGGALAAGGVYLLSRRK